MFFFSRFTVFLRLLVPFVLIIFELITDKNMINEITIRVQDMGLI